MGTKGQTEQERTDPVEDIAANEAGRSGGDESRCGGKHGNVQEQTMMEQVLARENLLAAWRRVKANAGAPGIDGMTVEEFPAFSRKHWPRIRSALMAGTYLQAGGVLPDGSREATPQGVPQGGPLSPLLANLRWVSRVRRFTWRREAGRGTGG